jgi:hypothetical protein
MLRQMMRHVARQVADEPCAPTNSRDRRPVGMTTIANRKSNFIRQSAIDKLFNRKLQIANCKSQTRQSQ